MSLISTITYYSQPAFDTKAPLNECMVGVIGYEIDLKKKENTMKKILGMLLFLWLLASCSENASQEKVLRYTAIPDQKTTELEHKFAPLTAHLSKVLGVPVEYVPSRDYQASVEMFRAQQRS